VLPAQQLSPGLPQAMHTPPQQMFVGEAQVLPGQHFSPGPPQMAQIPPEQVAPESLHGVLPAQQGWPSPPQVTH
jgi:hypothetical protein